MARILVLDDEPRLLSAFHSLLQDAGHEGVEAQDGTAGLKILQSQDFDLVITDLFMPEKDGFEVVMDVKASGKNIKVLAISGGSSCAPDDFLLIARRLGADAALIKSVEPYMLLKTVDNLLKTSGPASSPESIDS